jgi:hypothetical protein
VAADRSHVGHGWVTSTCQSQTPRRARHAEVRRRS